MISQDGVTIDNGKRVVVSTGTCAAPTTTAAADVVECAQGTRNDVRWVANSRRLFDPFLEFREYPNGLA
jgi:hypothetical protein